MQGGLLEDGISLSVTWLKSPKTKSKILFQQDYQNPPSGVDMHLCPSGPQSQGEHLREKKEFMSKLSAWTMEYQDPYCLDSEP